MTEVTNAQLAAAARQIVLALGGYAMGRGWLQADTLTAIGTVAAVVVPLVWGQASTRKLAKK
ncbi:hypothetical protein [Sphingobium bisphenolivorans]|uniref:Pam3-gp28 family putative phage holin n=1 Tax=Sphingobium bisphenolivorans TaxID=1335760 RepID=UPI0003A3C55C|nr:hypothetical protein [Sphingobium bisphenolivorans]